MSNIPVTALEVAHSGSCDIATQLVQAISNENGAGAAEEFIRRNLPEKIKVRKEALAKGEKHDQSAASLSDNDKKTLHLLTRRAFLGKSMLLGGAAATYGAAVVPPIAEGWNTGKKPNEITQNWPIERKILTYALIGASAGAALGANVSENKTKEKLRAPGATAGPVFIQDFISALTPELMKEINASRHVRKIGGAAPQPALPTR